MTAAQTYTVDVVYHGRDQGAQGMADHIGVSLQGLQGRLDAVTGGMERIGMMGVAAVGGVAAMGVRTLARDMVSLNSATQDTTIGIAGMLQANGGAATFANGMEQAGAALARIRQDADALPGEAQDFVNVFSAALPAALQSGMRSALDVSQFTNQFAAVGIAFHVDSGQAGRDLRQLLQGRAGADVAMWNNLQANVGKTAEQFNHMTAPQRLAALQRATGQYSDMVGAFGGTFGTATSTLVSKAHRLEELATKPLFDRATARLQEMGTYLTANGPMIEATVTRWGEQGAHAFDVLYERGARAFTYLRDHWREIVAEVRRDAETFARTYAGLRLGSGAISAARAVGGFASSGGMAGGMMGAVGGVSGIVGGAALLAAAPAVLALADGSYDASRIAIEFAESMHGASLSARALRTTWQPVVDHLGVDTLEGVRLMLGGFGSVTNATMGLASVISTKLEGVIGQNGLQKLTDAAWTASLGLLSFPSVIGRIGRDWQTLQDQMGWNRDAHLMGPGSAAQQVDAARILHGIGRGVASDPNFDAFAPAAGVGPVVPANAGAGQTPPNRPPHNPHTTNITNNFKIEQADNPERVALSVMHVIRRELRNPTQSARPGLATLR